MVLKLYAAQGSSKAKRILIAATYNGITVEGSADAGGSEGKMPVLETDEGCIFSTNAIARYVSRMRRDTGVYGQTFIESGSIDGWVEFCQHELEVPLCVWVYPKLGIFEEVPAATAQAKDDCAKAMTILDKHLGAHTFMVGHQVTLADITIACTLLDGFTHVMDAKYRGQFPNLVRWFETCIAQPQFKKVLGPVTLFGASAPAKGKASPAKAAAAPAKGKAASPQKAAAPAPAAGGDDAALEAVKAEIADKKAALKASGMSGGAINKDPAVAALVQKLQALKAGGPAPAAAAPAKSASPAKKAASPAKAAAAPAGDASAALEKLKTEIADKKAALKAGGMSGGAANKDPAVVAMVAKMQELKAAVDSGAAAPAAPAAAGSPKKGSPKKGSPTKAASAPNADPKHIKAVVKEGGKKGAEVAGAADMGGMTFMNVSLDLPDGQCDHIRMALDAMNVVPDPLAEETKGGSGHVAKALFSYGTEKVGLVCFVPAEHQKTCKADTWALEIVKPLKGKVLPGGTAEYCMAEVYGNGDKGLYPIKMKDEMLQNSIKYLQKIKVFPEGGDTDSDEMVFGDDDFPCG